MKLTFFWAASCASTCPSCLSSCSFTSATWKRVQSKLRECSPTLSSKRSDIPPRSLVISSFPFSAEKSSSFTKASFCSAFKRSSSPSLRYNSNIQEMVFDGFTSPLLCFWVLGCLPLRSSGTCHFLPIYFSSPPKRTFEWKKTKANAHKLQGDFCLENVKKTVPWSIFS